MCLSLLPFAVLNTVTKKQLGEKGSSFGSERSQGGSSSRSRDKYYGGMLLANLLAMACLACFLILSRTNCLGVEPPTVGWALLHH